MAGLDFSGKRLLICSPGIPHKSRGASTVLFYHYIERLKQEGFQILNLLLLQPDNASDQSLAEYTTDIAEPGVFEILPCWADQFVLNDRFNVWLDTASLTEARLLATEFRPEIAFCLDLLSAWAASPVPAHVKMVWLGDLNFQTEWYNQWYASQEDPSQLSKLPLAWNRARLWKGIYRNVLRQVDSVVVASKSSERQLARLGIRSSYLPYPWPALSTSSAVTGAERSHLPTFLFFGSLTGLGSRSAFRFMLKSLYPHLTRLWGQGGFQILIAGMRELPGWVKNELDDKPEFKYLGFVDDIDSIMATCHAVLAPIDVPVGNRSRIVTAMAKGGLVIAHKNAALGNPDLVDNQTCYLAKNAGQFVQRMRDAVERPDQSQIITTNARATYDGSFRPEVATHRLVQELARVYTSRL